MSTPNEQNASVEPTATEAANLEGPNAAPPVAESVPGSESPYGEQRVAAPAAAHAVTGAQPKPRTISTFLKVSIILLAALSVASISLLFIGDFQGKFERVFSTFVVFAVFVGLTALDTRRGQRNEWYAPVALIANSYILALSLNVI